MMLTAVHPSFPRKGPRRTTERSTTISQLLVVAVANAHWTTVCELLQPKSRSDVIQQYDSVGHRWPLLHTMVLHPTTPLELLTLVAQHSHHHPQHQRTHTETPLHIVCDCVHPQQDRIHILLDYSIHNPASLRTRDSFGRTSFLLACANGVDVQTLQRFVTMDPRVLSLPDIFGDPPIATVLSKWTSQHVEEWDVFVYLATEIYWRRSRRKDRSKNREDSIVHAVLQHSSSYTLIPSQIQTVLRHCTVAALTTRDRYGRVPLHYATTVPVAHAILRRAPQTAQSTDHHGRTPLTTVTNPALVPLLIRAHPEGLTTVHNGLLPCQQVACATASQYQLSRIYILLRSRPEVVQRPQRTTTTTVQPIAVATLPPTVEQRDVVPKPPPTTRHPLEYRTRFRLRRYFSISDEVRA